MAASGLCPARYATNACGGGRRGCGVMNPLSASPLAGALGNHRLASAESPPYVANMRPLGGTALVAAIGFGLIVEPLHAQDKTGRGDQNTITPIDIAETGGAAVTAYDVVRLLRPRWLAPPMGKQMSSNVFGAGGGNTQVRVYVDDIRQPDLQEALDRVKAREILKMKYLDQNRAVQEYGEGHEAGVIVVTTIHKGK